MSTNYNELAARAEHGESRVQPGTVRRGPEAAYAAQQLLTEVTGASNAEELTRLVLERPSAGEQTGE